MEKRYISEPMDFQYKEGNAVDFDKTFDLTGSDNDQMLKVYLRKAGLSDNIEYLTVQQRQAFIYDIVKSNKNPGYWKPSVMPSFSPSATIRSINPSTSSALNMRPVDLPMEDFPSDAMPSVDDIPPAATTFDYEQFSRASSSHQVPNGHIASSISSEEEYSVRGTLYERQFLQQRSVQPKIYNAPPTPPSPSTMVNRKGLKIEIGTPMNFQHISGDMTRDMTQNAFDLSGQFNDNSLKKYMIERGITAEDVSGMDNKELIRRIIQSKYTWVPNRKQFSSQHIPPPPSEMYVAASPTPPPPPRHKHNHSKGGALIVAPPTLPTYENNNMKDSPPEPLRSSVAVRPKKPPPVPPSSFDPHKTKALSSIYVPPPPPPPPQASHSSPIPVGGSPPSPPSMPVDSKSGDYTSPPSMHANKSGGCPPPPPPPMPSNKTSGGGPPPPPPPMPSHMVTGGPPPPPPPPSSGALPSATRPDTPIKSNESGGPPRDALLESIRAGVALKKVKKDNQPKSNPGTLRTPNGNQAQTPASTPPGTIRQRPIKPEQPDFMSELRNATLKRIKKLENNPYANGSEESNC